MNITINQKVLDKYNLSLDEFLVLLLCNRNVNIKDTIEVLIAKGICQRDLYDNISAVISSNTKELISSILIKSDSAVIDKEYEFSTLADKLRDIFPAGKKEGTTYQWRDTTAVIAKKLQTIVVKYGFQFTEEEAINATRKYVESFNGNYRYMQLLKYFILKTDNVVGDIRSDFMSLIQNKDDENHIENDFVKMR